MKDLDELDAGYAVDHRMVQLQKYNRIATGMSMNDCQMPQGVIVIEQSGEQFTAISRKCQVIVRGKQHGFGNMVREIEFRIVFPGGMRQLHRAEHDPLPIARQQVHPVSQHLGDVSRAELPS